MYAILAEHKSDVETLKKLVERISQKQKTPTVIGKGYDGCGELLRKGARDLKLFSERRCNRFVICYDADRDDPEGRKQKVLDEIVVPSKVTDPICVLVPVQEIEAWIIADLDALARVIPSWRNTKKAPPSPESINDPKEYLRRLTKVHGKPIYSNATHNPVLAQFLDVDVVYQKCPSFRPLHHLVRNGTGYLG